MNKYNAMHVEICDISERHKLSGNIVINQVIILFLIMVVGFFANKKTL